MDTNWDRHDSGPDILRAIRKIGELGGAIRELGYTFEQITEKLEYFNEIFGYSLLERFTFKQFVPKPKRGGTFFYCTTAVPTKIPKYDKNGRKTRYTETVNQPCNHRVRQEKTYRRHWRRVHAPVLTDSQ